MLSKHPNPEREEPATSPALARRRDHMLRSDAVRHIEPRLLKWVGRDVVLPHLDVRRRNPIKEACVYVRDDDAPTISGALTHPQRDRP